MLEMRDGGHMTKLDEIDWNIDVVRAQVITN